MSTIALEALHRVAREVGVMPVATPDRVATEICREFHRMRSRINELEDGLERANHRIDILTLEGSIP